MCVYILFYFTFIERTPFLLNKNNYLIQQLTSMAASSSSSSSAASGSPSSLKKYDVFISFRGEDTRKNITSHLYKALCDKGIETYIDERSLDRGDEITPALLDAIHQSNIAIVVFSQDYASSSWCLRELVHILKCREEEGQIVLPVFYHVDPSDIRKQKGSYAKSFENHEKRFKDNMDEVREWRSALEAAAGFSGWDSKDRSFFFLTFFLFPFGDF